MQNKKKQLSYFILGKKILNYSLVGILAGIFLLPKTACLAGIAPEKIINLTNQERSIHGLKPLTANQILTKAAYGKGADIFESQTFQHNIGGKKFSAWIREAGYDYSYVGENLAIDFLTAESAMGAWLASPTHRNNILNPRFKEIGVAVLDGRFSGYNTTLIVQIFGSPPVNILANQTKKTNRSRITAHHSPPLTANYQNNTLFRQLSLPQRNNFTDNQIITTKQMQTKQSNIFSLLNKSWPIKNIDIFLGGHIPALRILFLILILAWFAGGLSKSPRLQYWLTAKNQQLKLPLK